MFGVYRLQRSSILMTRVQGSSPGYADHRGVQREIAVNSLQAGSHVVNDLEIWVILESENRVHNLGDTPQHTCEPLRR